MKKNNIVIALLLISVFLSFFSCGKRPDETELISRAKELITASAGLNEIYWGKGFDTVETYTETDYLYIDYENSVYDTVDELKAATESVFTYDMCKGIYGYAFVGINGATESVLPKFSEDEMGYILQNKYDKPVITYKRDYRLDTLKIVSSSAKRAVVTVESVTDDGKTDTLKLVLLNEGGVFLLDSPTY